MRLLPAGPYFCQGLGLQGLVVPQAAVPGGAARRPHAVPFGERLLVGVVDAAGAPERRHPPLLGALDPSPGEGDFVGAAGTGGGPGRCVYAGAQAPGRAVCSGPCRPCVFPRLRLHSVCAVWVSQFLFPDPQAGSYVWLNSSLEGRRVSEPWGARRAVPEEAGREAGDSVGSPHPCGEAARLPDVGTLELGGS